jgi:hypothetical protein
MVLPIDIFRMRRPDGDKLDALFSQRLEDAGFPGAKGMGVGGVSCSCPIWFRERDYGVQHEGD